MRDWILTTTHLLHHPPNSAAAPSSQPSLDEIAACARISLNHLRAYYTSVHAIDLDLPHSNADPSQEPRTERGV